MSLTRVGVVGATGYVGAELCRWLLDHPQIELAAVYSRGHRGEQLADALPAFQNITGLTLTEPDPASMGDLDAIFLAVPHGMAKPLVAEMGKVPRILDLSSDHRHAAGWVYGLAEWNAPSLSGAARIAVPGCFATAVALAGAPFVHQDVLQGVVGAFAATGSTGSGVSPSAATHHPERFANLKPYKVLEHQHVPEVRAFWESLRPNAEPPLLHLVPCSAPIDRGILATLFLHLKPQTDGHRVLREAYAGCPMVRLRTTPELRWVRGSAFCDLGVHQQGDQAVVISAIDNLGKGAATQAVQCLNLAMGWPESTGLLRTSAIP